MCVLLKSFHFELGNLQRKAEGEPSRAQRHGPPRTPASFSSEGRARPPQPGRPGAATTTPSGGTGPASTGSAATPECREPGPGRCGRGRRDEPARGAAGCTAGHRAGPAPPAAPREPRGGEARPGPAAQGAAEAAPRWARRQDGRFRRGGAEGAPAGLELGRAPPRPAAPPAQPRPRDARKAPPGPARPVPSRPHSQLLDQHHLPRAGPHRARATGTALPCCTARFRGEAPPPRAGPPNPAAPWGAAPALRPGQIPARTRPPPPIRRRAAPGSARASPGGSQWRRGARPGPAP